MTTNSIAALAIGEACYTFFLNAQGRIQGDATVLQCGECIEMETASDRVAGLMEMLDRYIIMDDVELEAVDDSQRYLALAGPVAEDALARIGLMAEPIEAMHFIDLEWRGSSVRVVGGYGTLVARYEIWADAVTLDAVSAALVGEGFAQSSAEVFEQLRMLEGTPRYGVDIRDKELPQETGQTRALHFSKGCYLGQEIVERIHSRGNVHRQFTGFLLTGAAAAAGMALTAEDAPEKAVGELTSVATVELAGHVRQVGLGYIRREVLDRQAKIGYPGGEAMASALPFAEFIA